MRTLLARRGFRDLLIGQAVSALGDWMGTIAMMVLVLDLTGSSAAVGGMLVLRLLPAMVAGPLAARIVGRWSRRRTMLAMDAVRAGIAVLVPLVAALWWVYLWAFLLEVASLVFLPARDASIPDLAGDEDLPLANGVVLGSSYCTIPLGAAAFGGVVALQGALFRSGLLARRPFLLVFLIDAGTFIVSYALVRGLRVLDEPGREAAGGAKGPVAAWTRVSGEETPGGFLDAFRIPLVRAVMPATATAALGVGTLFSVGVVFIRGVLRATDTQFGMLIAVFGVGAAAGLGLLHLLARGDHLGAVRLAVAVQGAVVAAMSLAPTVALTFLGAAGFGGAASASLAAGMSVLQARLEGRERVLAFTAFHVVIRAGLSLAALGAGLAVDLVGGVRWPGVGRLEPARLVLFCSGLVVLAGAALVREPRGAGA